MNTQATKNYRFYRIWELNIKIMKKQKLKTKAKYCVKLKNRKNKSVILLNQAQLIEATVLIEAIEYFIQSNKVIV